MEETRPATIFKTKDGIDVEIINNGTHYVARDADGMQVGLAWVMLASLKDELGIEYNKSAPASESSPDEKAENVKTIELQGKLADGTPVRCIKDKYYWRCFNKENKQLGEPFVDIEALKGEVGIELEISRTASADAGKPEHSLDDSALGKEPVTDVADVETGTDDVPPPSQDDGQDDGQVEEAEQEDNTKCDGGGS